MAAGAPGITSMSSGRREGKGKVPAPFMVPPRSVNPKLMLKLRGQSLGLAISIYKGTLQSSPVVGFLLPALKGWGGAPAASCAFPFILLFTQSPSGRPASVCLLSAFSQTSPRGCAPLGKGCAPRTCECGAAASTADGCRLRESPLSA